MPGFGKVTRVWHKVARGFERLPGVSKGCQGFRKVARGLARLIGFGNVAMELARLPGV